MNSVERAYEQFRAKKFQFIYVMMDLHGTIVKSTYDNDQREYYSQALAFMRFLNKFPEVKIILWSSCHPDDQKKYLADFAVHGIKIDYFNENPEVKNTVTGCFDQKFYFSIGIDDKFNFNPETDYPLYTLYFEAARAY